MKKLQIILIVILLTAFCFTSGFSQDKPLKFGPRLGTALTLTNADISGLDLQPRFVLNFGAFVEYWASRSFGFQGDLLYNKKGAKWNQSMSAGGYSASVDLIWSFDYLSIPIYGKAAFGNKTRLYLLFGPEFSFLLSAKQKVELSSNISSAMNISDESDVKDSMKSFELAFGFGLGIEIPVSQSLIMFIDSRSSVSLTGIFKEVPTGYATVSDESIRNIIGALNIGLIF